MKKLLTFSLAGAAIVALSTTFTACNTPKDPEQNEGTKIQSISVSDEVADFFDEHVGLIARSVLVGDYESALVNRCALINSADEILEIDGVPAPFPPIDFNSQTLVLGQWIGGGGLYLVSQTVYVEQAGAVINLTIGQKKEEGVDYDNAVSPVYFWGLYSKINAGTIHINVTHKK